MHIETRNAASDFSKKFPDNTWMMKIDGVTKSNIIGLEDYMIVYQFKEVISDAKQNMNPSQINMSSKTGEIEFTLPAIPTLTNLTNKVFGHISNKDRSKSYIDSIELVQVIFLQQKNTKILQKIQFKKCILHTMTMDISSYSGRLYQGNYLSRIENIYGYNGITKEGFGSSSISFEA
jgi:hypothetical protein